MSFAIGGDCDFSFLTSQIAYKLFYRLPVKCVKITTASYEQRNAIEYNYTAGNIAIPNRDNLNNIAK